MKRYRMKKKSKLMSLFRRHRHVVRKSMRGLTSIPVRFRGWRI